MYDDIEVCDFVVGKCFGVFGEGEVISDVDEYVFVFEIEVWVY